MRTLSRALTLGLLVSTAVSSWGCGGVPASPGPGERARLPRDLAVRRGEFRGRFLLTGELQAVRADEILVPRTPVWMIPIRWMEADGATVAAGQKILEFDNTAFASDLEERRLALTQAESDLTKAAADRAELAARARDEIKRPPLGPGNGRAPPNDEPDADHPLH